MKQDETKKTAEIDRQQQTQNPADELCDQDLEKVSGGVARRGGNDDLDELEVER